MDTAPTDIRVSQDFARKEGLKSLTDLNKGDVIKRDTSYSVKTTEVKAMADGIRDPQKHWPGFWYELLQGALDYNDWAKGNPSIVVTLARTPPKKLTLPEFISEYQGGFVKTEEIQDVQVHNFIRNKTGLRPRHVALTDHDAQELDQSTLGRHGRGLSIATTAARAGNFAQNVTFQSYVKGIGAWYGEADVLEDPIDWTSPKMMALRYKRDEKLSLDETVITVVRPNRDLVESLVNLPEWFLPVNQYYRFHRTDRATKSPSLENKLTFFANPGRKATQNDHAFDTWELLKLGVASGVQTETSEPARVEILPEELFHYDRNKIDFVFVDGLRVDLPGSHFSHIWSFWGVSDGQHGYNPKRSNDSMKLEGKPADLIQRILAECTNPDVFVRILEEGTGGGRECYESKSLENFPFANIITATPPALAALKTAWESFTKKQGLARDVLLSGSSSSTRRANGEKREVYPVYSVPLVTALTKANPGLKAVEEVWEEEAYVVRIKLREEELRHQQEMAEKERLHKEALERKEKEKQDAIEAERRRTGIAKEAAKTGESLKVAVVENSTDTLNVAEQHLLHLLALNDGRVSFSEEKQTIVMEFNGTDVLSRVPSNTNDFGDLTPVIHQLVSVFGDTVDLDLRAFCKEKGVYFKFGKFSPKEGDPDVDIFVQRGDLIDKGNNLIRISFNPIVFSQGIGILPTQRISSTYYTQFYTDFLSHVRAFADTEGKIDPDKYLASEMAQNYPPSLVLVKMRRQREEIRWQMEKEIEEANKQRVRYGLKPIEMPKDPELKDSGSPPASTPTFDNTPRKEEKPPAKKSRPQAGKRLEEQSAYESTISLTHPDSVPGLSTRGERKPSLLEDGFSGLIESGLRRVVAPDFILRSAPVDKTNGYLLAHINPAYSQTGTAEYFPLDPLPFGKQKKMVTLIIGKKIDSRLNDIYCPPGYEPVGYFHPDGEVEMYVSGKKEKGVYAVQLPKKVPAGLTFYFRRHDRVDRTQPDEMERANIADRQSLSPHWKNLLDALDQSSLTAKQKTDVLLRAWVRAFTYDKSQETFDKYDRTMPASFVTQIINNAEGNCGYAGRGMRGLLGLAGIPSREVASYLHDGWGNYNIRGNYHLINQVFMDGRWVLLEPQQGYLEERYSIEQVPGSLRVQFDELINAIPERKYTPPQETMTRFQQMVPEEAPASVSEYYDEMMGVSAFIREISIPSLRSAVEKVRDLVMTNSFSRALEMVENDNAPIDISPEVIRTELKDWFTRRNIARASAAALGLTVSWRLAEMVLRYAQVHETVEAAVASSAATAVPAAPAVPTAIAAAVSQATSVPPPQITIPSITIPLTLPHLPVIEPVAVAETVKQISAAVDPAYVVIGLLIGTGLATSHAAIAQMGYQAGIKAGQKMKTGQN